MICVCRHMARLAAALLAPVAAFAQAPVDASRVSNAERIIERRTGEKPLACEVKPFPARLGLNFEFNTGYSVRVPLKDYTGRRAAFGELIRVTPEGGRPVYLVTSVRSRPVPHPKAIASFGGGFLVGEGRYTVDLAVFDPERRFCRKSWRIHARAKGDERSMKRRLGPGEVAAIGLTARSAASAGQAKLPHLTVLMHIGPFGRGLTLRASERVALLVALASLLEQVPAKTTRVVVFNLDQQREIYRQDRFEPASLEQVWEAMSRLELATVEYGTLKDTGGRRRLLAELIANERSAAARGDAVVFLGPPSRYWEKLPEAAAEGGPGAALWFNFQCRPLWRNRRGVELGDLIERAVSQLGGKTVRIHDAREYAKAIALLRETAGRE